MDTVTISLIIIILTILGVLVLKNQNTAQKPSALKKDEIIKQYTDELQSILNDNSQDKELQIKKKKQYLQKLNGELSRNIFFEPHEAKELLARLASM